MIAQLRGEIVDKTANSVVIDVQGVGYEVLLSSLDLDQCSAGQTLKITTYLAVRENALDIYGFLNPAAKQLFLLLTSVSGVGPKVGLSILSLGEPSAIKSAIAQENVAYITSANGVGKRGAEKVIVELKDKVGVAGSASVLLDPASPAGDDAFEALVSLGYSAAQATQSLSGKEGSVEERIKAALKELN